jgi:hypothetical protein
MSENEIDECVNVTNITHRGLDEWFKSMFEKLGWIVLASANTKFSKKIVQYEESIDNFLDHADTKYKCTSDIDRKDNIAIMIQQATYLKDFVNYNFGDSSPSSQRKY